MYAMRDCKLDSEPVKVTPLILCATKSIAGAILLSHGFVHRLGDLLLV